MRRESCDEYMGPERVNPKSHKGSIEFQDLGSSPHAQLICENVLLQLTIDSCFVRTVVMIHSNQSIPALRKEQGSYIPALSFH